MARFRSAIRRADPESEPRDRWRRWILAGQGGYYVIIGAWPLLHFTSFARVAALPTNPFQAHAFAALIVVVGGSLLEATRRGPPGPQPTLLGAAVAGAIALVELLWLPRMGVPSALWFDLAVQVAIGIALALLYPREENRTQTSARRRL